jgi:head-tail adaptor
MNSRFEAGKIRHRVTIVAQNPEQDGSGGMSFASYTTVATVWASVEALSGDDALVAGADPPSHHG